MKARIAGLWLGYLGLVLGLGNLGLGQVERPDLERGTTDVR